MAALLLFGLMAAVNVQADNNAADNWTWTGELRTSENGQEMYILNVGSKTFISNENKARATEITDSKVKSFKFWGENEKSASISNDDKYRIQMKGERQGLGDAGWWSWTTNVNSGSGATVLDIIYNTESNSYTFASTISKTQLKKTYTQTRYFNVDKTSYTAAETQGDYNHWLLISPAQKDAYVAFKTAYDNANAYTSAALPVATKNRLTTALAAKTSYKADNYDAVVEELQAVVAEIKALTYTVNISDNYATVCLDFNAIVPAGVAAYRLDNYDADKGNMTLKKCAEEGEVLPAGQGFVLHTDNAAAADYNFVFADDKTPATIDTNLFSGTTEETTQEDSKYYWVISNHPTTGKIGFFILNDEVKIPAHKAYFAVDRSQVNLSNCSVFSFDNNTTGIHTAAANKNATIVAIYNAAGKQQASLAKGLNIVKMSDGSIKKIMK